MTCWEFFLLVVVPTCSLFYSAWRDIKMLDEVDDIVASRLFSQTVACASAA